MHFDDRIDAARQLAYALRRFRDSRPLILAIPRGAVPMGKVIADELNGDLDVVLVRKLRSPSSAELAVGSVDETGWTYVSEYARDLGVDDAYLKEETRVQIDLLRQRRALYTPGRAGFDPAGRVAIVIDDGLATGATMIAALHSVRTRKPAKLVCAVPVASMESLAMVEPMADEVICLAAPPGFRAVGQFYRRFDQVSDDEVVALLARNCVAHIHSQ